MGLNGNERKCYDNQRSAQERKRFEHHIEKETFSIDNQKEEINENSSLFDHNNNMKCSLNSSGVANTTTVSMDVSTQTEFNVIDRPEISKRHGCTDAIKSTCPEVLVKCYI